MTSTAKSSQASFSARSILLIRLGAIGDVVNALVLANALKRAWPDCVLGWAVHPKARPVLEGHPALAAVHELDPGDPRSSWRALDEIRSRRYALAIDLQRLFKSGLLCWLSGAPRRLGFDFNRSRELSWLFSNEKLPPHDPQRHVVDQYLEFARYLGVEDLRPEWRLAPPAAARETAARLLDPGRRWAVLHLGAGKPANRWHAAGWARVTRALESEFGLAVALVGGAEELETARVTRTLAGKSSGALDLTGKTTLEELMAVLERAALVVSCDSGPMHLGVALGRPVIGLFGPANPLRTGPYGQMDHVVDRRELWCAPCFRKKPCNHYECMPGLRADLVVEKVREVLREG